MSADDAAYRLVHDYPGGVAALAARAGLNPNTLAHKLNPSQAGHRLQLREAEMLTALSGSPAIAHAMAQACGHVCIPMGAMSSMGNPALLSVFVRVTKELGDVAARLDASLADGRISLHEQRSLDSEIEELIQVAAELRRRIDEQAQQDRDGRHLRAVPGQAGMA